MKIVLLGLLLSLTAAVARAQNLVPPEIVRFENVHVDGDVKTVTVGNVNKHYSLYCNVKTDGCITPEANKNYFLLNKDTRFMMPGAKTFLTLEFVQDMTVKYNKGENIGLVAAEKLDGPDGSLGVFLLDTAGGGYEQDTIFSDGPIIYGAGLSAEDRQKAWKRFFLQMVEACDKQQGRDALGLKLAKRCLPGQDFCTMAIDANFVGIGGIQEPRKVLLLVSVDLHDQNQQLARTVCTYPAKGTIVCRDWDTGKLVANDKAQ
jgi:hypothetical protein